MAEGLGVPSGGEANEEVEVAEVIAVDGGDEELVTVDLAVVQGLDDRFRGGELNKSEEWGSGRTFDLNVGRS